MDDRTAAPPEPPTGPAAPVDPAVTGRRRLRPVWWALGPVLMLVAGLVAAGAVVHAPYVMYAPGSAVRAEPQISVPDGRAYDSKGDVLFTTVSLIRPTYLGAIRGWLDDDIDVVPRTLIYGDQSDAERRQVNVQLMDGSKLVAARVAFEHLGYDVAPNGVTLVSVVPDGPAAGILHDGDVIVALDGTPIRSAEELAPVVDARAPGDTLRITVERAASGGGEPERRTVDVTLGKDPASGEAIIGVLIQDRYDFPFDVTIDSGEVGGPSAGLAWTLGLLDRLTPGSLTGGRTVAVTGEIDADGDVLQVGGVKQKVLAARSEGATLFLVPRAEAAQARPHAGDMRVVPVDDLQDALRALDAVGGNALHLPRAG